MNKKFWIGALILGIAVLIWKKFDWLKSCFIKK
jgi:hypothetical protein